jgi:hypothetical protein
VATTKVELLERRPSKRPLCLRASRREHPSGGRTATDPLGSLTRWIRGRSGKGHQMRRQKYLSCSHLGPSVCGNGYAAGTDALQTAVGEVPSRSHAWLECQSGVTEKIAAMRKT